MEAVVEVVEVVEICWGRGVASCKYLTNCRHYLPWLIQCLGRGSEGAGCGHRYYGRGLALERFAPPPVGIRFLLSWHRS